MPASSKTYPEWVQAFRERGTTVKKKGDAYYLYKRTSKRVKGKKYPQPVDTYIGLITPDGVVKSDKKKVSLSDIEVYEYGFTKALLQLCPEDWKKPLGADWEDILAILIAKWSPNSFLLKDRALRKEEEFHYQFPAQAASLSRRIYKQYGLDLKELEPLKTVYLVILEKEQAISKINDLQQNLILSYSLSMELD